MLDKTRLRKAILAALARLESCRDGMTSTSGQATIERSEKSLIRCWCEDADHNEVARLVLEEYEREQDN